MTTQLSTTLQSPIPLTGFDSIKADLIAYLQSLPQFTDYNFAGSNLQVIINLLAYNTYYNILYHNLSINEMFLDSASKRDSVVSRASELGYLPPSTTSAVAMVNLHVNPGASGSPAQAVLPAFSQFSTSINGTTYNFYTLQSYVAPVNTDGSYDFNNVTIVEGTPVKNTYTFTGNTSTQIPIVIANQNSDVSTLSVNVYASAGSDTYTVYNSINDLTSVTSTTPVYFIKEIRNQLYEVSFGQGGFGMTPPANSIVQLTYLVSSGPAANGAYGFAFVPNQFLGATVVVTTTSNAAGGAPLSSLDTIRFNAPRQYAAQNRAVIAEDYIQFAYQYFPSAQSINAWGGEDNVPPQYGQVFICVQPTGAALLTSAQSSLLVSQLKNKAVTTIIPKIVPPDQLLINITSDVYYNPLLTNNTPNFLQASVTSTISNFGSTILKFGSMFRYSNLLTAIDQTDPSILGNTTSITLTRVYNNLYIYFGTTSSYSFVLGNPIEYTGNPEEAILTTGFMIAGDTVNTYYIDDDGVGNLRLFYYDINQNKTITNTAIGTVDYSFGQISIPSLNLSSVVGGQWSFNIKPQSYDVYSYQSQILSINQSAINVNVIVDPTSTGQLVSSTGYPFSSIRS